MSKPFNSKVIKSFVPELRSRYVFFVLRDSYVLCIFYEHSMYISYIRIWLWYRGSVMVWGMISGDGVGPLVWLQGKVNAGVYKQLVKDHVLHVLRNSTKQPSIFMQDNAPCHKAMVVMNFLKAENVTVMDWAPQNPDLNPIENVWKTLGKCSKARNPKRTEQLWNALQEEWNKITQQDINELISSCSRRCQGVNEAKRLHTKY